MFPTPGLYDLTPKPGRQRFGIARKPFQPPRRINATSSNALNMPPRIAANASKAMKHKEPEEDILRAPESDSDSSDDNLGAPMYKSTFEAGSSQHQTTGSKNIGKSKAKATTINGKPASNGTRKSKRAVIPCTQESDSSSPKRKSWEQPSSLGSGMFDEFGRKVNKKQKTTKAGYGSKPSSQARNYSSQAKKGDTPPKTFQTFDTSFGDSDDSPVKKFEVKSLEKSASQETPSKGLNLPNLFENHSVTTSPSTPGSTKQEMKLPIVDSPSSPTSLQNSFVTIAGVDSSPIEGDEGSAFVNPDTSFTSESQRSPVAKRTLWGKKKKNQKDELPSLTQLPSFVAFEGISELVSTAQDMIDENVERFKFDLNEDDSIAMTQRTRCPMCRKPVDAEDLKAYGAMDTRKQEQFCQSHQKRTAMEEWDEKGYPEIDWENLDARISKHHKFIKKLINGSKSYYRDRLQEVVDEGKDRNLLKSNANLTPGYFGGRGLRLMSENIMNNFTPLLKKRAVKDKLVAARTVAGFVQSVCVQEVAALMIMEDMEVEAEEAREILESSAGVGELVNEEIREVVTKKIDNSEGEESLDDI
ncbi:RTC4-like domain-containing protein [Tricladium varicosporioides]|nr:RTC4-like domain-containing protein [Hymenoscyphus varicosporioides]